MKSQDYQITIKFDSKANQTLVSASGFGLWMDLGLAMEGIGTLMAIERNQGFKNPKGIKTNEDLVLYICDYIARVSQDYNKSFEFKTPKTN